MLFPRIHPQTQHADPRARELPSIHTAYEGGSSYREQAASRLRSNTYDLATEEQKATTTVSSPTQLNAFYHWQTVSNGKINPMWL